MPGWLVPFVGVKCEAKSVGTRPWLWWSSNGDVEYILIRSAVVETCRSVTFIDTPKDLWEVGVEFCRVCSCTTRDVDFGVLKRRTVVRTGISIWTQGLLVLRQRTQAPSWSRTHRIYSAIIVSNHVRPTRELKGQVPSADYNLGMRSREATYR